MHLCHEQRLIPVCGLPEALVFTSSSTKSFVKTICGRFCSTEPHFSVRTPTFSHTYLNYLAQGSKDYIWSSSRLIGIGVAVTYVENDIRQFSRYVARRSCFRIYTILSTFPDIAIPYLQVMLMLLFGKQILKAFCPHYSRNHSSLLGLP